MIILWIGMIAAGLAGVWILHRLCDQPPRCPDCKVLTEPVPAAALQEYPSIIGLAHQCPRCARMVLAYYGGDVVWGTAATSLLILDQKGMLAPYAPKGLERVVAQFKDRRNPPQWVGIDAWETAFCVNTVEAKAKNLPIPETYTDLLKPAYKGLLVMPNPASSGTGYLTVSAILQLMGEQKGWEFMDGLHKNIAMYTHFGSKPCKQAGAGEFPIGISFGYRGIQEKQKGAPVQTVFPKEGSGWDLEANALMKKSQIKPAAKVFLVWAISQPAMKEYAKSYALTSVSTGDPIPEGYPKEPVKQLIQNDFNWAAKNRARILEEWGKRYDGKSEPKS
jgi:iron(III) transport system substrate-binding protein